jgi:Ras-related C3 botulinum toxin substrate 1
MWIPELQKAWPDIPSILVGSKSDLRDQFEEHAEEFTRKGWEPVLASKGEAVAKAIGAERYIECSATTQYNVREVFDTAIKVILHPPEGKQRRKENCEVGYKSSLTAIGVEN